MIRKSTTRDTRELFVSVDLDFAVHRTMRELRPTLERLGFDVFTAERQGQVRLQLANTLTAVIAQRLVPRVGGGILAVYEVLLATSAIRNLIREGKTNQLRNAMVMSLGSGHLTMEMSLNELVRIGYITQETAVATAFVPPATFLSSLTP